MEYVIQTEPVAAGWAARAPELHLSAHGRTEQEASDKLKVVLATYDRLNEARKASEQVR